MLTSKAEKFLYKRFTPIGSELQVRENIELLNGAFTAWQERFGLLANKMKLMVTPMDGSALWQYLYQQFNGKLTPTRPLPHWIELNAQGELRQKHHREHSNSHNPRNCSATARLRSPHDFFIVRRKIAGTWGWGV